MQIRRLGWAGIELEHEGSRVVIDLFEDNSPLEAFTGPVHTDLPAPAPGVDAALVTHLHTDHADPGAIERALRAGGPVLRPHPATGDGLETIALLGAETALAERELELVPLREWESNRLGPFTITAVPAVDGFGDPQISWVVEAGGKRVFHGGDTIFHGYWWLIAMRCGPIDVALLPINGARCDFPHRQPPSPLAAVLEPEQAAAAAQVLGAGLAVPIHYDAIDGPPAYAPVERPTERFSEAAERLGVAHEIVDVGEEISERSLV